MRLAVHFLRPLFQGTNRNQNLIYIRYDWIIVDLSPIRIRVKLTSAG